MTTRRQWVMALMAVGLAIGWAGAGVADAAPGGLPLCRTDLATCNTSLATCTDALAAAQQCPATGQTTAYIADKNGIAGATVPDDGTVQAGATLSYQDNGDGTITDLNTGLMWEKKDDAGGLHDKDNTYPWSSVITDTTWDWLDGVNAEGGTGFAGYTDWRLPNVKELQSFVNYEIASPGPTVSPAFNVCSAGCSVTSPTCSCTQANFYWSSTTIAFGPASAWGVYFDDGVVNATGKFFRFFVRAVRGGL